MITDKKWQALRLKMATLGIDEADISEQFIVGSGRGGQKLQKTSSCVRLHYSPANIMIKCDETRSRVHNRFIARRRLCEKIEAIQKGKESAEALRIQKLRRQKAKRSRRAQQKVLDDKRHQGRSKARRKKPEVDGE